MPIVKINWLQGSTVEQKRKIAEGITKTIVEIANAKPEAVTIAKIGQTPFRPERWTLKFRRMPTFPPFSHTRLYASNLTVRSLLAQLL